MLFGVINSYIIRLSVYDFIGYVRVFHTVTCEVTDGTVGLSVPASRKQGHESPARLVGNRTMNPLHAYRTCKQL